MQQPRQWRIKLYSGEVIGLKEIDNGATGEYRGYKFVVLWSPKGNCFQWEVSEAPLNGSFDAMKIVSGFQDIVKKIDALINKNELERRFKQSALSRLYSSFDTQEAKS